MGCTTTTLKFALILMNILCAIFGALIFTASAYSLADFPDSELIQVPCAVGIILGFLLFLTSILGCCGPFKESVRAIWIYSICIVFLMIAQIVVNLIFSVDFDTISEETVNLAWQLQFSENNGTMAEFETNYTCCGKDGPDNYVSSGLKIPIQCYKNQNSTVEADLYTIGCITKIREQFEYASKIEVISDWTLVGVEGLTAILAGMLAIHLKNVQRRKQFH